MKRYRTLDYKQVQKYVKRAKLHLHFSKNHIKRIQDLNKLRQQLQINDGKINTLLTKHFEHNLKLLPHLLSLPMTYSQALLQGVYSYVPELRKKYNVNGYCSATGHYYFVFHKANRHSNKYWIQLHQNIYNAIIPIYYETLIKHDLKRYLFNFRDMCYSNRAIVKFCIMNTIKLNRNKHQIVYTLNNHIKTFRISNKELQHAHKLSVSPNRDIALYNIRNRHILIQSHKLVQITQ